MPAVPSTHAKVNASPPNANANSAALDSPVTPPSPTPSRPVKNKDTVDSIVLKHNSVFSALPPATKNPHVVPAERRPWPSHSATRAHLPAHADIQVQRQRARAPPAPPKHRHVPARLSIMPRSSSGLVIATPTSMVSLTALLDDMPTPGNLSLAAELEQAEASFEASPDADADTPEDYERQEQEPEQEQEQVVALPVKKKPLPTTIPKEDDGPKDVPPPYTQNVSSSTTAPAPAAGAAARTTITAPTPPSVRNPALAVSSFPGPPVLGPPAPITSAYNANSITPIPLSVLSARRPSTPMGRLMGAGGSNLSLSGLGIGGSEPASPFSPGFNELGSANNGFARAPTGPLAFLANSQRTLALDLVSMAMGDDLASLSETNAEIKSLKAKLAGKEAEAEAQRSRIRGYTAALDSALASLEEEKSHLIAMRERLFVCGLEHKDDIARGGQSAHMALRRARSGWCRLWIDC